MAISRELRERLVIALTDTGLAKELETTIVGQLGDIAISLDSASIANGQAVVFSEEQNAMIAALVPLLDSESTFEAGQTLIFNSESGLFEAGNASPIMEMADGVTLELLTLAQILAGTDAAPSTINAAVLNQAITQILEDTLPTETPTSHEQPNNSPTQEILILSEDIHLARNRTQGLFNAAPSGATLEWANEVETEFDDFNASFRDAVGANILDEGFRNSTVRVVGSTEEFNVTFTNWQQGGASSGTFAGWSVNIETFESITEARLDSLEADLENQNLEDHADVTDDLNLFVPENGSVLTLVDGVYKPVELSGSLERIFESPVNPDISTWNGSVSGLSTAVPIGSASGNNATLSVGDIDPEGNQMYALGSSNISTIIDESLTPGLNLERNTRAFEGVYFVKKNTGICQFGHTTDTPNPQAEQHVVEFNSADGTFTEFLANATNFTLYNNVVVTDLGDYYQINLEELMLAFALSNSNDGRFILRGISGNPVISRPYILGKYKQVIETSVEVESVGVGFNSQSTSSYYDIGNVRHMFGFDDNGSLTTSVRDIVLPAEFADNEYVVTPVAVENGGVNVICTLKTGGREVDSFRIEVILRDGGISDAGVMWHAIGLKPSS